MAISIQKTIFILVVFVLFFGLDLSIVKAWEEPVPSVFDSQIPLGDKDQPGSRLFYLSNEGNDVTASIYFWDGTNIVDDEGSLTGEGGVAYGTDPMNPSGPIKTFKRWSYVAPRGSGWGDAAMVVGYPWDGTSYRAPGGSPVSRYGYPDWWLFKRGETFDLYEDYLSFAQESVPSLTEITGGTLAMGGGRSATERQFMGAYGDVSLDRPRFINSANATFVKLGGNPKIKHVLYQSLHFDGRGWNRTGGISITDQDASSVDILLEDVWVDGTMGVIVQNGSPEVTFRRCIISDSFKYTHAGHTQGIFFGGRPDTKFRIEESYILRNGFTNGDPADAWPPTGEQIYDIFNRNMYLGGDVDHMNSGVFDSVSMIGASGDQFRQGMRVERNFFYQGYLAMGGYGGKPDEVGPTGTFKDNVQLRFAGKNTNDNRGQPNWGITLSSGAYQVEVSGNIVTGAQYHANSEAFGLSALDWYCYSHLFHYPTRNNNIFNNIFDSGSSQYGVRIVDGVRNDTVECSGWTYPGVQNNSFYNNTIINEDLNESRYTPSESAIGTENDTNFHDNGMYETRQQAAQSLGWPDPERTLKSYMQSLGYTVNSDDGFLEYFNESTKQRRGNWDEKLTPRSLVNYFREGFGMELLAVEISDAIRFDVDGSSQITTTDALLTLRNSLGLSMSDTAWRVSATTGDVNCDGVSNSTDALLILRFSLGLSMSGTEWCE